MKTAVPTLCILLFGALNALQAFDLDAYHTFTDTQGRQIEARIVSYQHSTKKVSIKTQDNRKHTLPIEMFSKADQDYILEWRAESDRTTIKIHFMSLEFKASRVVFVIDKSGSMSGDRWNKLQVNLKRIVDQLDQRVEFNFVLFGSDAEAMSDQLLVASPENKAKAKQWIDAAYPSGGTNLTIGIEKALTMDKVESLVVLSDGYPNDAGSPMRLLRDYPQKLIVHTVSYYQDSNGMKYLKDLAKAYGGKHIRR